MRGAEAWGHVPSQKQAIATAAALGVRTSALKLAALGEQMTESNYSDKDHKEDVKVLREIAAAEVAAGERA